MTWDFGNPGPGLEQAQKCGVDKRGSQPSPLDLQRQPRVISLNYVVVEVVRLQPSANILNNRCSL